MQFLDRLKGALRGRQVSSSPDKLEAVPLDESAQAVRRRQNGDCRRSRSVSDAGIDDLCDQWQ